MKNYESKSSRIKIIIGIVLIVLIATNPSISEFKNHAQEPSDEEEPNKPALRRKYNFFILSIYEKGQYNYGTKDFDYQNYLGVLANFIKLPD